MHDDEPIDLLLERITSLDAENLRLKGELDEHVARELSARRREETLRSLVEHLPDVFWTSDATGRTHFITANVERLYGFSPEEIYREGERVWLLRIHAEDRERVASAYARSVAEEIPFDIEYRIQRKDGAWIWIHDRAVTVYRRDGVLCLDGIISDVTPEKVAEDDRLRLVSLVENSTDFIAMADLHGTLRFLNASGRELIGLKLFDDVTTLNLASLAVEEDRRTVDKEILPALLRDESYRGELRFHHRVTGRAFQVEINAYVMRESGGGGAIGIAVVGRDVTARTRAAEAIQRAQDELEKRVEQRTADLLGAIRSLKREVTERTRAETALHSAVRERDRFFELSTDMLCIASSAGAFRRVNRAFERTLGYPDKDLLGHTLLEFTHPEELARTHEELSKLPSGETVSFESRVLCRDGSYRWIAWKSAPDLQADLIYATGRDVSVTKRVERELRGAKEAAESASRARSQFLANVSHEIRTPMNGIIGMTELALETKLDDEQREYLSTVRDSAESLLSLINDILDLAKIEAAKLEIDRVDWSLRNTLGDIMKTLAVRAHEKGLELTCDVSEGVPDGIVGDPMRFRQIIVNLVGNAVKFTDAGDIAVSVSAMELSAHDVLLHCEVKDTGVGIAKGHQQEIFEPFTQADSSVTRRFGGTGLGLSISAELVSRMGGRIWVESEAGEGATFHFTMRCLRSLKPGATMDPPAALAGRRALIVDDNAASCRVLEGMLACWRMHATTVHGALTALDCLADVDRPFDVVLIDANMPGIDGFALARKMREQGDVPLVMLLSSIEEPGVASACRKMGSAACVVKPVKQSDLLYAVIDALGESLPMPPIRERRGPPPARRALRILLAEDNRVNRRLAVTLLKRRGHQVTVAVDGKEALVAYDKEPFDAILMDVQMPEMSGLEVTEAIRRREKVKGTHTPIIAMTAHAMKGDRERCLAVGMDGYVSKPVDALALYQAVERTGEAVLDEASRVIDPALILATVRGDARLFREMVEAFLEDYPKLQRALEAAVLAGDAALSGRAAHTLKGMVSAFSAGAARDALIAVEEAASRGRLEGGGALVHRLGQELDKLAAALSSLSSEAGS